MIRPFKLFHDGSHLVWFEETCEQLSMKPADLFIHEFSNGNVINRIDEDVSEFDCFVMATQGTPMTLYKETMLGLVSNLAVNSEGRVNLLFGYMPNIRSDKEDQPRIVVAARDMADQITLAGAHRAVIFEPHFKQISGFFDRKITKVSLVFGNPLLVNALMSKFNCKNFVSVAADLGGSKTAGLVASKLNVDIAIIDKRRIGNEEKAVPYAVIGKVKGKDCVITDDEIASGSTFYEDVLFLLEKGAKSVIGMMSHAIMTNLDTLREIAANDKIPALIVCDTVPISQEKRDILKGKLFIVHTAPVYAEAIRRLSSGGSFRGPDGLLRRMWDVKHFPPVVEVV